MKLNGSSQNTSRVIYIDILRIVSVFTVVILHVSAPFVEDLYINGVKSWWAGNILDSATRWCVPVLIMISGKLMLDSNKEIEILSFLNKRLRKIFIPLIFWSFIYMIWYNNLFSEWNLSLFKTFIINLYEDNIYIHLWYLYMIIGLYLITPIIKIYINNDKNYSVKYFLSIWFLANGIIGFLEKFTNTKIGFNLSFFHWSIGYYILGFFLDKKNLRKGLVNIIHILGSTGLITTIVGTYITTKNNGGNYVPHLYSYFAPNVIFMSISIFLLFKNISWEKLINKKLYLYKLILTLSNTSFGIYLVHLLVLDIISSGVIGITIDPFLFNPIIGISLVSAITFLLSYFVVIIFQKIPLLNKAVPK